MTLPVIAKALLGASLALVALVRLPEEPATRAEARPVALACSGAAPRIAGLWALATLAQALAESWSTLIFGRYWRACLDRGAALRDRALLFLIATGAPRRIGRWRA